MAHASSVETALHVYPKLYRVLIKSLRKACDQRMIYRSPLDMRNDAVQLFWLLIGQNLVDLADEHSKRGMWSWREENNIALTVEHHVIALTELRLYTQRDMDIGNFYYHHAY